MNKELAGVLETLRDNLLYNDRIVLTKKEAKLIIKYINDLERTIAEGVDN